MQAITFSKNSQSRLSNLKILFILVGAFVVATFLWGFYNYGFWFSPPLVPLDSINVSSAVPSWDIERGTEFETPKSDDELRQFYRNRLALAGWRLHCSVAGEPPCKYNTPGYGVMFQDVYERIPGTFHMSQVKQIVVSATWRSNNGKESRRAHITEWWTDGPVY